MTPAPPAVPTPRPEQLAELAERLDTLEAWLRFRGVGTQTEQIGPSPYNWWFQSEATARAVHGLLNLALYGQADARRFPGDSQAPILSPLIPTHRDRRRSAPTRAPEL